MSQNKIWGKTNINTLRSEGILPVTSNHSGLFDQLKNVPFIPHDPSTITSISVVEKEHLETIELAADLLASSVISAQEYFKLKLLLKSKDEDVRKAGIIFLNEKAKL